MLPYVLKVSDRAGSECISRLRYIRFCLPYRPTTSAPWNFGISRLNTRPIRSPVNASAMSLLPQPHDSGSVWFATPSLYDYFIHYTFPVLTGALWASRNPNSCRGVPADEIITFGIFIYNSTRRRKGKPDLNISWEKAFQAERSAFGWRNCASVSKNKFTCSRY